MKEIPLTQGKVALVDDEDYDELNQYRWYAQRNGGTWYAQRSARGNTRILMHASLTGFRMTDHIDRNGLNNQRANLRNAGDGQNQHNRCAQYGGSSSYKGVHLYKPSGRWRAQIGLAGRRLYIGSFDCEEDAAQAYDDAARALYGEWAALNFPNPGEQSAHERGTPHAAA